MSMLKKLIRGLFTMVVTLVVTPTGIILYVILESLRVAKQIEIKVDKLKKGK
jgi:hypothetical protein